MPSCMQAIYKGIMIASHVLVMCAADLQLHKYSAHTCYELAAGLQDAYDDLVEMFTHRQEDFPVAEVLGPVCVQMTNPKDDIKLAREADFLSRICNIFRNCLPVCALSLFLLALSECEDSHVTDYA